MAIHGCPFILIKYKQKTCIWSGLLSRPFLKNDVKDTQRFILVLAPALSVLSCALVWQTLLSPAMKPAGGGYSLSYKNVCKIFFPRCVSSY